MVTNKVINGDNYRKVFLVGDIHGHVSKLMFNLDQVGFDKKKDLVVSVGDLVDRGPENEDALDLLLEDWFVAVIGNHEVLYVGSQWHLGETLSTTAIRHCHIQNGGRWVYKNTPTYHQNTAELIKTKMTDAITLHRGGMKIGIVHGDIPRQEVNNWEDMFDQSSLVTREDLVWGRSNWEAHNHGCQLAELGGVDFLVLGHSPVDHAVCNGNTLFIDTTVYHPTGYLTIINVDNIERYKDDI